MNLNRQSPDLYPAYNPLPFSTHLTYPCSPCLKMGQCLELEEFGWKHIHSLLGICKVQINIHWQGRSDADNVSTNPKKWIWCLRRYIINRALREPIQPNCVWFEQATVDTHLKKRITPRIRLLIASKMHVNKRRWFSWYFSPLALLWSIAYCCEWMMCSFKQLLLTSSRLKPYCVLAPWSAVSQRNLRQSGPHWPTEFATIGANTMQRITLLLNQYW